MKIMRKCGHEEQIFCMSIEEEEDAKIRGPKRLCEKCRNAAQPAKTAQPKCVKCGKPATMNASMGPSCANCYDELS